MMTGMAITTASESLGLVTTIIATAPISSRRLRSACEITVLAAALTCVVSAVSRDITSPECDDFVEGGAKSREMLEHVAPDVGHDALAEPVDAIEARGARQCEHEADADQRREIFVDEARIDAGEAEIDHAPARQAARRAWRPAETRRASSDAPSMPLWRRR